MKFLQNWSLKRKAIAVAIVTIILLVLEGTVVHLHYRSMEAIRVQVDFARSAQLQAQSIELSSAQFQADPSMGPAVLAGITRQEYLLNLIRDGGWSPENNVTVRSLQRLPRITFARLEEHFKRYKQYVQQVITPVESEATTNATVYARSEWLLVTEWYGKLIKDLYDEIHYARNVYSVLVTVFLVIDMAWLAAIVLGFVRAVLLPVQRIQENTTRYQHTQGLQANELGMLATRLNDVIEEFRDATDFVKGITTGKLDMDYRTELDTNYVPGKNQLADSLIEMQSQLKSIREEEQRRKWANEGLARFVDILRSSSDDLNRLGDKIISTLVSYTRANQGGLYVVHDEAGGRRMLELIALYAFNSKKFESQKVRPGEGLLGQTYLEGETVYLTEIPEEYIRITSGLGDANPRSILIVPLKVDKEIYGMVELASFHEFMPHEITFVEKLGETIASTLASVRAAQNNRKLLEESRMTEETMRSQEEEMRQNMEELTATQEEMQRILKEAQQKETFLSNLMDATTDAFVAIDRNYRVILRNNAPLFAQFAAEGIRYEPGFHVLSLFKKEEVAHHKDIYDRAFAGETLEVRKEYYQTPYAITYSPLKSATGEIVGASIFAQDIHEREEFSNRIAALEGQLAARTEAETLEEATSLHKTLQIQVEALAIAREELEKRRA